MAVSAALLAFILLLLRAPRSSIGAGCSPCLRRLASGLLPAWRRRPPNYLVAQILDHRLGLADTLSTATFFRRGETRGSRPIRRSAL